MIFNESTFYALFLLPCVAAFHIVPARFRAWVITAFGVAFFAYYGNVHFGGLWGSLCVGIFVWELLTSRLYRPGSRWCLVGIVQAIVILCAFKYMTFLSVVWDDLGGLASLPRLGPVPRLVLPLGVSFFTFEFIHYAADVYAGKIRDSDLATYSAFIFFFPTMVAGPIKRYEEFAPKLHAAEFDPVMVSQGVTRILVGLAKKHALADTFDFWASKIGTDAIYSADEMNLIGWLLAYGMKIYFDFSGYSDIAIGCSYLFGIRVPENFNFPYLAGSISDFWRRWHISLGRWIFDYVYRPLGGSKLGEARTSLNLLIAFAISGIWHGAAYNFLIWGLWHGVMMIVERAWRRWSPVRLPHVAGVALTFAGVSLGWLFFCTDVSRAFFILSRIVGYR